MSLADLDAAALPHHLEIFGACHTMAQDHLGPGTIVLLGPREPGFWAHVTQSSEYADGASDPMDRWSARVIGDLADVFEARPLFPFGNPRHPFITWALKSGHAWSSPVGLLVHETAGLMVSFRGALLFDAQLDLPERPTSPCLTCDMPCVTACPVGALTDAGYALDACHAYLDTGPGTACMQRGCNVRRQCPVSQRYARVEAQSAYHMDQFHPASF